MVLTIPLYDDNPTMRPPVVTVLLIVACAIVFLWQQSLGARGDMEIGYSLGMVPAVLFGGAELPPALRLVPPAATVITSMFLHGGWMHIIGNMLFLWIFGNNVEDALGHFRFLAFYLACGIVAALAQGLTDPASEIPMIGASGAIAGVLGAYIVLHPHANVRVFVWIVIFVRLVNVPAWILLGLWFATQLFSGLATPMDAEGGVAFWAHVGGFVAGILLVLVMRRPNVPLLQPAHSQAFRTAPIQAIGDGRRFGGGSVPPSGRDRWPPRPPGPWG
jgi:membrane associated rhomboid family serine protease